MKKMLIILCLFLPMWAHSQLYAELGYAVRFFHLYFQGPKPPEDLMNRDIAFNKFGVNIGLRHQFDPRHSFNLRLETFKVSFPTYSPNNPLILGERSGNVAMHDLHLSYRRHFKILGHYKWKNFKLDNVFVEAGPSLIFSPYTQRNSERRNNPNLFTLGAGIGAGITVVTPKDYQLSLLTRLAVGFRPLTELIVPYEIEEDRKSRLTSNGSYLMTSIVFSFPIDRLFSSNEN